MCGIHGVVTSKKREPKADDFIKQGFVAGSLRGIDSSGMASISAHSSETAWQKLPIMGPMFVGDKLMQRLASDGCAPNMITICHTRSATSGPIGINEAHPFYVSDTDGRELIGVHNGSLTGWHGKKNAKDFKVDSEWALNHIFDEAFDAFEDFSGAFVFVWWDSKDHEVFNVALNDSRPLYVGFTENDNMIYASEAGMLYWLAERNGIKLVGKVRKLLADFWYKFDINNLKDYTKTALPKKSAPATTTRTPAAPYKGPDHVGAVRRVLDLATGQPNMQLGVPPQGDLLDRPKRIGVSAEEVLMAKDRHAMGMEGEFHPLWDDEDIGEIWGTFVADDTKVEMDAIIRNGQSLAYQAMKTVWKVKIIGMNDDGLTLMAVCTHPTADVKAVA